MGYSLVSRKERPAFESYEISSPGEHFPHPNSFLRQRLGLWAVGVTIIGSVFLLGVAGFLIFLWGGKVDNLVWKDIVLASWLTRAATLSALAIRWAVSAQAAVAAALLASIALQRLNVQLPNLASVSVTRYSGSGPHNLVLPLFDQFFHYELNLVWPLVMVMCITTVALQLTSTILLSDLKTVKIAGYAVDETIPAAWNSTYMTSFGSVDDPSSPYLSRNSTIYPRFADHRGQPYHENFIYDTGQSFRALLPIQSAASRMVMSDYTGPASIMDTRTICIRPEATNLTVAFLPAGNDDYLQIWGSIGFSSDIVANQYFSDRSGQFYVNCTAPLPVDELTGQSSSIGSRNESIVEQEWPFAICPVNYPAAGIAVPPVIPHRFRDWRAYLVLNTTGSYTAWHEGTSQKEPLDMTAVDPGAEKTEWEQLRMRNSSASGAVVTLSMSLCFFTHYSRDILITASASTNHTEPDISWSATEKWYDTKDIRRSFGITLDVLEASPNDYGQLEMDVPADGAFNKSLFRFNQGLYDGNKMLLTASYQIGRLKNTSIFLCTKCRHTGSIAETDLILAAIINDAVRFTGRPGLAVQTLFSILSTMPYYDQLPAFNGVANATIISLVDRLMPQSRIGLTAVLTVLATHLILLATVLTLFIKTAGHSATGFIGNSWLVVSQVAKHPEVDRWLSRAATWDDNTVETHLRHIGKYHEAVDMKQIPVQSRLDVRE